MQKITTFFMFTGKFLMPWTIPRSARSLPVFLTGLVSPGS